MEFSYYFRTFAPSYITTQFFDNMKKIFLLCTACAALVMTSCKDKDLYDDSLVPNKMEFNDFNFSTVQEVNLTVDYSAFQTYGPVMFDIYSENPYVGFDDNTTLRTDIAPLFKAYTDNKGKFNDMIKLPAYAKDLYVVTGNFMVAENVMNGQVKGGAATFIAQTNNQMNARASRKASAEPTTSPETLYQLSYEVDVKTGDKATKQVYKDWFFPLGSWDRLSGRPNYLLDKTTASEKLFFTEDEMSGLYETVANALVANQTCNPEYCVQADLTVVKESEVAVAFLGSMTCWNNTLGYYYYNEDNKPTDPKDLNIIMLFPNTQDGHWWRNWCTNPDFYGNIALNRGESVQLLYYPNIASGDLTTVETKFPQGTKIGFIMKTNGWGMQKSQETAEGTKKFFNSYNGGKDHKEMPLARQYNVWAASTDGLSYCNTAGLDPADCKIQNPNNENRTAKFAYKAESGEEYAIVGFEDACNDLDYDDIVLALKPADAFMTLPKVEDKTTSATGVYAFEDLWPSKGDYDMNDVMVELTHEKTFSVKTGSTDYKIVKEKFLLTTYQNYVTLKTSLALTLNTKVTPSSIVMKKVNPETNDTTETSFIVDGKNYLLTEDIKAELGTTYILEVNYTDGLSKASNSAEVKPFIYRPEGSGRWEVHIPMEAPTNKMITSYFGTEDDRSVPAEGIYYVRNSEYPFAFYLDGVTIAPFMDTLLKRENEKKAISVLYEFFLPWAKSKGTEHADWYLHPTLMQ